MSKIYVRIENYETGDVREIECDAVVLGAATAEGKGISCAMLHSNILASATALCAADHAQTCCISDSMELGIAYALARKRGVKNDDK